MENILDLVKDLWDDYRTKHLNSACAGCTNYIRNGGGCPGDFDHSFYYPTDCDSWSGHADLYEEEQEYYGSLEESYWD